jgi:hypothetical protein
MSRRSPRTRLPSRAPSRPASAPPYTTHLAIGGPDQYAQHRPALAGRDPLGSVGHDLWHRRHANPRRGCPLPPVVARPPYPRRVESP